MSIGESKTRNNTKEKGNQYCNHNMAGDHNTGTACYLDMGNRKLIFHCNAKPLVLVPRVG